MGHSSQRVLRGTVVYYPVRPDVPLHETHVHGELSRRLARLLAMRYGGKFQSSVRHASPVYFVPSATLVGVRRAEQLGIHAESDLFGGVVPYRFVRTKAITHPLVSPTARAPTGWSVEFGKLVADAVLRGFTAFSLSDAKAAGLRLLEGGTLRVKPVDATAGRGQTCVDSERELDEALAGQPAEVVARDGLVLEENLEEASTYSVGQMTVGRLRATYVGTQRLTPGESGELVYGGSDLVVVRGDFGDLLRLKLSDGFRRAISQARIYDRAANACFPGFFASRRNYDAIEGFNSRGEHRSGVLEQSWRVGGASTAEIAALEGFDADPSLRSLRASSFEIFGNGKPDLPENARACFRGVEPGIGLIHKYVVVENDGNP